MSDANEPHHAANMTVIDSNHSEFEEYIDNNRTMFGVSSGGYYNNFGVNVSTSWSTYCGYLLDNSAKNAKNSISYATKLSNTYGDWDKAGINTLPKAQYNTSGFLYNFLKSVGQI